MTSVRTLALVLGDQLDRDGPALRGLDPARDAVWMAEVRGESTHVWSHVQRTALFLAAMRHCAADLRARGLRVVYQEIGDDGAAATLGAALARDLALLRPERAVVAEAGDFRVERDLRETCAAAGVPLDVLPDTHFLCSRAEFADHARGRRQLRLEFFYREMRRRHGVLLDDGEPCGGSWNYDAENRGAFGRDGPGLVPRHAAFPPDEVTRRALDDVRRHFPGHPGSLDAFDWPVTPAQAREALRDFIDNRLADFGRYQDAMWSGQPVLWHARISAALNLKLLDPREAIRAAEAAYRAGRVPLASAEGFIRQILGWREYVRGIYGLKMPGYAELNALGATEPLPAFYWTGATEMRCLRETIGQTLRLAYAHHIQRLMVTGLYALLHGVRPQEVHAWYLAVYADAVEWVELPNTLGMSQYADGGLLASKPYVATGKYIERMSDACRGCRFRPERATGDDACPFTTLYWDFLMRHEARLARNPRMALQVRNLARLGPEERDAIRSRAAELRRAPV